MLADNFTVISPDLRGRGKSSPAREVEGHRFEEHADDVVKILDAFDIDRAAVVGSSFGAAVAVATALRHQERVTALVLLSPAFGAADDPMGEGDLTAYGRLGDRIAAEGRDIVAAQEAARTGSSRTALRWGRHDEASLVAWLRAVPLYRPFRRADELASVTVPVLVMPGNDATHTRELGVQYATASPNAKLLDMTTDLRDLARTIPDFLSDALP